MIFNKYHIKKTKNWYFEWAMFVKYEKMLLGLELDLPTPKSRNLFFGITIFTCTLFFFDIAYIGEK